MKIIYIMLCTLLFGCSTSDKVLRIRSIETITNPSIDKEQNGTVIGLKALTDNAMNTNIVLIHGMGWTQESSDEKKFGEDLINAILDKYPRAQRVSSGGCSISSLDGRSSSDNNNGLKIYSSNENLFSTDDPKLSIKPGMLGCLDRVSIKLEQGKTITVYRFLWDDAMWDRFEWRQIGYDDRLPSNTAFTGYDNLDKLRATYNAKFKNAIVTYGFADASLYMGPVGSALREGVQGAICVAISNSFDSAKAKIQVRANELCSAQPTSKSPLLLMSHSLGSRLAFDTLTTDLSETLSKQIEAGTSNNTIELHMLANQLPLIGLGRMGENRSKSKIQGKNLKFVAYSEINDLLTYELVPYFEQMCYTREGESADSRCNKIYSENDPIRKNLSKELGFDAVDVRLSFAPNLVSFYSGFKNPSIAHIGYLQSTAALNVLFCGVSNGIPNGNSSNCSIK